VHGYGTWPRAAACLILELKTWYRVKSVRSMPESLRSLVSRPCRTSKRRNTCSLLLLGFYSLAGFETRRCWKSGHGGASLEYRHWTTDRASPWSQGFRIQVRLHVTDGAIMLIPSAHPIDAASLSRPTGIVSFLDLWTELSESGTFRERNEPCRKT
jgi:hypothetical protein